MKKGGVVLIGIVALIVLSAGAFFLYVSRTPSYSLRQLAQAVENRDKYDFEKYVDVDDVAQSAMADMSGDNALMTALAGTMVPQLRARILKSVEDGSTASEFPIASSLTHVVASSSPEIVRRDKNAFFTLPITSARGNKFGMTVHMTQVPDGYWRIDRITNLKDWKALQDKEERERKDEIRKANAAKIDKLVIIAKLHTSVGNGWRRQNRFQIRFQNQSDKIVTGVTGEITVPRVGFDKGIRGDLKILPGATANDTWGFDVNQFMQDTEALYSMGDTDDFAVELQSVSFADGSTVSLSDGL